MSSAIVVAFIDLRKPQRSLRTAFDLARLLGTEARYRRFVDGSCRKHWLFAVVLIEATLLSSVWRSHTTYAEHVIFVDLTGCYYHVVSVWRRR